jgi:hypothetical protein
MPFDSTPIVDAQTAVQRVLDALPAQLGPNGENWRPHVCRDYESDGVGCILQHVALATKKFYGRTWYYHIHCAVRQRLEGTLPSSWRGRPITAFNDAQESVGPVLELIERARRAG